MIERILIKNIATYDKNGVEISDLDKINFIYGTNGSGKTTISRLLNNYESAEFKNCQIKWKNDVKLSTYVYNKDFCDENFGKSDIEGIFTLGSATKKQIEEINKKKEELNNVKKNITANNNSINKINEEIESLNKEYKDIIWSEYKKNENNFKDGFKGYLTKDKFFMHIIEVYKRGNINDMDRKIIEKKSKQILGKQPEKKELIKFVSKEVIKICSNDAWNSNILGKNSVNISKLIDKLKNADWVNHGRKYITTSNRCPFCQKETIDDNFREQLEMFFDEEYESKIKNLENLFSNFIKLKNELLAQIEKLLEMTEEYIDVEKLKSLYQALLKQVELSINIMNEKIKEPSKAVTISTFDDILDEINNIITKANEEIKKNNLLVDNYTEEKKLLIENIWKLIAYENKAILDIYISKMNGKTKGLDSLTKLKIDNEKKKNELIREIKEKNKNVTSVQPAVDEINRLLLNYGFTNFSIVPSKEKNNHYQIQRPNGSLVEATLSEGEVTFITFLYFLQLIKGSKSEENVSEDRIIVIDDPISSLDSSVLFVVSSLLKDILYKIIKEETNIKQAIILTHNVYFHKEISFVGRDNSPKKEMKYWILRKKKNVTNIKYYGINNPISSSYQLLWKELKDINCNSCITIQNIMRRIIENYFKILGGYKDETLLDKFPDFESKEICRSLLSWINDGSHCLPDDLYIEMPDEAIDKYQDVFKRIFEYTNHIEHYNMMMQISDVNET